MIAAVLIIRFCVKQYVTDAKSWDSEDIYSIMNGVIIGITILVIATPGKWLHRQVGVSILTGAGSVFTGLPLAVTLTLAVSAKVNLAMMSNANNFLQFAMAIPENDERPQLSPQSFRVRHNGLRHDDLLGQNGDTDDQSHDGHRKLHRR